MKAFEAWVSVVQPAGCTTGRCGPSPSPGGDKEQLPELQMQAGTLKASFCVGWLPCRRAKALD